VNFATLPSDTLATPWYSFSIRGIAGNGQLAGVREAAEGALPGLPPSDHAIYAGRATPAENWVSSARHADQATVAVGGCITAPGFRSDNLAALTIDATQTRAATASGLALCAGGLVSGGCRAVARVGIEAPALAHRMIRRMHAYAIAPKPKRTNRNQTKTSAA